MHLSVVDGLSTPHARVNFGVSAHHDSDVFGRGSAPVSEDVDRDEGEPSIAYVPVGCRGVVLGDPPGLCGEASTTSPSPLVPAVICRVRPSPADTIRYHGGDRVVGVFIVDAPGCADECLIFFFIIGRVLREVVDDVPRDGSLPVSPSTGNGGKNADVVVSGLAGGTGHGELLSVREHWQGVAGAGPHGLPAFATPDVGIVVIVVSTPPERDNCGVGSTCQWSPTLSLSLW